MNKLLLLALLGAVLLGCGQTSELGGTSLFAVRLAGNPTYTRGSERLMMDARAFDYAYAPSMIRTGNRTLAWACTMRNTGGDVIRLTYSDDRVNWSAPGIVLTHSNPADQPFACDPAMVFYNGYDYLYWGGYDNRLGGYIALARSPLSNPAGFAKYVGGDPNAAGSWRAGDTVTPAKLFLPRNPCGGTASCYGVGQPTVVLRNGLFHLWYTDTTAPVTGGGAIWYSNSANGVNWSAPVFTNVYGASVDVKFDVATSRYVMFELQSHIASPAMSMRTSADGLSWSAQAFVGTAPAFANNIGVEGTPEGFIDTRGTSVLVGYGAPYGLAGNDTWGKWNLYGAELALGNPPPPPTPTPPPAVAATAEMRRLYARASGDHLLTTNASENPGGYVFEGIAFRIYVDGTGRLPIYRCYVPGVGDHFVSPRADCEGQRVEGLYGYLAPSGGTPVYRCFNGRMHLVTADSGECARAGFRTESVLGYAP